MQIIPAVDMLDHRVVQLVGGVPGSEKIVMPDPFQVAGSWIDKGARYLHLVDLDGAFGKENNIPVIKRIIAEYDVPVEVGGGIRDASTVEELVNAGADRVIVGYANYLHPEEHLDPWSMIVVSADQELCADARIAGAMTIHHHRLFLDLLSACV